MPRTRRLGPVVEQHREQIAVALAVHERGVALADDREALAGERSDECELPQWLAAVEPLREQRADQAPQLRLIGAAGQRRLAHVVAEFELGIVDPHRAAETGRHAENAAAVERRVRQPLAVARREVQTRTDMLREALEGGGGAVEQQRAPHVHVHAAAVLDVEQAGFGGAQAFHVVRIGTWLRACPVRLMGRIRTVVLPAESCRTKVARAGDPLPTAVAHLVPGSGWGESAADLWP